MSDLTKTVVDDFKTLSGVRAELMARAVPPVAARPALSSTKGSGGGGSSGPPAPTPAGAAAPAPRFVAGGAARSARALITRHASVALRDGSEYGTEVLAERERRRVAEARVVGDRVLHPTAPAAARKALAASLQLQTDDALEAAMKEVQDRKAFANAQKAGGTARFASLPK